MKLIGTNNCNNCEKAKLFLEDNNLIFEYVVIDNLTNSEKNKYKSIAKENKQLSYPLLFVKNNLIKIDDLKEGFKKIVIKRCGNKINFELNKIIRAISLSMKECGLYDIEICELIALEIMNEIKNEATVEFIQDLVEDKLLQLGLKDVAKKYIVYREIRAKERQVKPKQVKNNLLSDEFISKYKHTPTPMNPLGNFVYYRTYSRWLPNEKRREYWWETVRRAVEYNCSLTPTTREEAEKLYDNVFNLRQFLSGRTFWIGGTQVAKENPMANFNCAGVVIDSFDMYKDLFYALMVGTGIGFRVLKSDVDKLPKIRTNIKIIHQDYTFTPKDKRQDNTQLKFNKNIATIIIGDSKQGWCQSLDFFLKLHYLNEYREIDTIILNYDFVRPYGERLVKFGGFASGHDSLKNMFMKINKLFTKRGLFYNSDLVKLQPIDCMDIANIIGENVVVGGVRRTAEITLFDSDDEEIIQAKNNLYKQVDGEWIPDKDILHRRMSNNSIMYFEKPTREKLHWHIEQMRYSGEPAFYIAENALKRRKDFKIPNPCFRGDMRLLTTEGYKTFEELCDKEIDIINKDGNISKSKVWCSGEKEIYEIRLYNNQKIYCTNDHRFMTIDGEECEAKDLSKKQIMPYLYNSGITDKDFELLGFVQGDGNLSRLNSIDHKGIEINIGIKDKDVNDYFNLNLKEGERKVYFRGLNDRLRELEFSSETLPNRILPKSIGTWSELEVISFLKGLYSANGSVLEHAKRVTLKTTCKTLSNQVQDLLSRLGISSYITTNKENETTFANGTYICKESYDVNIASFKDKIKFYNTIGFIQKYKMKKLKDVLVYHAPKVSSVKSTGTFDKVYDFTEPLTHWGVVEGVIVHNCGEILLDSQQLCNLTTINLVAFVEDGKLNKDKLYEAQKLSVRASYRMTNVTLELHDWDIKQKRDRLTGCSLTGYQDMINMTNMSTEEQKELLSTLRDIAHKEGEKIAKEIGGNPPLLATSVKPEGSLSLLPTVSSGLHFSHSPYYIRRVRINSQDPLCKVCEELGYPVHPEVGQTLEDCNTKVIEFPVKSPNGKTKYDVSALEQLEIYKMFMENYVDHNASITVHVRNHEWEDVEQWLWDNWEYSIGISFLSLDESYYPLLPYEACSEEEYIKRKENMKTFSPSLIYKYEKQETEIDAGSDETCASGACGVR